jgi:lipoyl(octanoyl) transferase
MQIHDLGTMNYNDAWAVQEQAHAEVLAGGEEKIFLVEHPAVITLGRRPGLEPHVLATPQRLGELGVEVVHSDRGGEVTFHGPGQLVVYPIIRLSDHGLSVSGYVHALEDAIIAVLGDFGIAAKKNCAGIGVWVSLAPSPGMPGEGWGGGDSKTATEEATLTLALSGNTGRGDQTLAKICAIGVRIRRGVSLHGLALNVDTDLNFFNLIVPCGMADRPTTSVRKLLSDKAPAMTAVKAAVVLRLTERLGGNLNSESNAKATAEPPRTPR